MTTDFRAMCAELIEAMTDDSTSCWQREADVIDRARALLAQQPVSLTCELPEPEGPPAVTISDLLHPGYKLCAELIELCTPVDSIPQLAERLQKLNALADRARALLAQPEPERLTDEELLMLYALTTKHLIESGRGACNHLIAFARAVLARWGRPTPQPVAVSERPWERDGWCDAEGRCYGWDGDYWVMVSNPEAVREHITHWLPANALPTPEATND